MSTIDDLRAIAHRARGIPGSMGMRPHRVWLCRSTWSSGTLGAGTESEGDVELTEGGGQPPKVEWLDSEALALGGYAVGSVEVGNLTPAFVGGGVSFSELIGVAVESGETLFVRIVGPRHPEGVRYRIRETRHKSAVSYSIVCSPEV